MEDIKDALTDSPNKKEGFFSFVFNFDKDTQSEITNILQYVILSIIPLILLLRGIRAYVPEEDPDKNNIEIIFEILVQVVVIFVALFFIHRIIIFIPTYSKTDYKEMNMFNFILVFLFILFTMQTKLGAKVNILFDRFNELIEGTNNVKTKSKGNVKVSQPLAKNNNPNVNIPQHQPSQADNYNSNPMGPIPPGQAMQQALNINPEPDFNQMYANTANPLVNAQEPGMNSFEPMAANSGGNGAFGSLF